MTRKVSLIIDAAKPYDRKIIQGVADYVQERGGWSLYVEEDPLTKLPDFRTWGGDGVIANFDARKVAEVVGRLDIPVVGVGGGYGWYDPATRIPYFMSDNEKVSQLAAQVGVGSVQYLSTLFSDRLGMPPGEYRGSIRD